MLKFRSRMSDSGFSMLEILIALSLFAIILASTGWAIVSAVNSQAEAEARDRGIQIAQDAMSIALKTDYDKLGFTAAQNTDAVNAGWYESATDYTLPSNLNIPNSGQTEARITLPDTVSRNSQLVPYVEGIRDVDDWTNKNLVGRDYTVVTNITEEASGTDAGGNVISTGKRVTIMVQYLQSATGGDGNCGLNNSYRCVYQTFLRNPSANEQIPVDAGDNTGNADGCDQPAPFCRVYASNGNVIAKNPGPTGQYPLATPVNFFIETREKTTVQDVSVSIDYPEVDRGKVCGDRSNVGGTAIEYGFCGNGDKVPAKAVYITAATADNPAGFRLLSNQENGDGLLFMATIPAETAANLTDPNYALRGYIRAGTWPVKYTVNNQSVTHDETWTFSDDTPLTASVVGTPVVPNGQVRFAVNGLSPNTQPYGESLKLFGSLNAGPNKSATDHVEITAQFYNPDGTPYEKTIYVMKDGVASWDALGTTMSQGYTIPASQITSDIVNPNIYGPQNFIVKVKTTRAVDNITTVTALKIPISGSSIPSAPTPSAPQNLSVNNVTDVATWTPPAFTGGKAIVSYTVNAYDAPVGGNLIGSCSTSSLTCTIPNIVDNNTYYVDVFARNKWKTGDVSTPRFQYTSNKATAPGAPTALNVTNLGVATWTGPTSNGGRAIQNFTVNVYTAATGGSPVGTCTVAALTCTISGLTNGTNYYADVYATNVIGNSAPSSPRSSFLFDTTTVPGTPTGLAVTQLGVATWTAPVNNGGLAITGYTVKVFAASTGGTSIAQCTSVTLTCTLTGLTDNTTYYAEIFATNSKGNSVPSAPRTSFLYLIPNATGGNSIYTITVGPAVYRVHEFRTVGSATFRPNSNMTIEYLVVGGGGGGGYPGDRTGGGGGGGGFRTGTLSLTGNSNYTVTVGGGGGNFNPPQNGGNSVFGSITSLGGGRGGQLSNGAQVGGSGGGGYHNNPAGVGAAGTAGQGFAGATGYDSANVSVGFRAGGGGGAGAAAPAPSGTANGTGGAGKSSSITGTLRWYAGGGGGGTQVYGTQSAGGTGGGGAGAVNDNVVSVAGTANTGGGGGGGSSRISGGALNGAAGGSGVVIVRYQIN